MDRLRILDVTAGRRNIWWERSYADAVFVDIRREVKPDLVCDLKALPFRGEIFRLVVFDPPHENVGIKSDMFKRYGHSTIDEIKSMLMKGSPEMFRVLEDGGFMLFKWSTHSLKLGICFLLMGKWFKPLFGHKVAIHTKHESNTYWVCMVKRFTNVKFMGDYLNAPPSPSTGEGKRGVSEQETTLPCRPSTA